MKWNPRHGGTEAVIERALADDDALNLACSLAALAYNVLRLIGQNALAGDHAPRRHPAKRRRLAIVIAEMLNLAGAVAHHARQRLLVFGAHCLALTASQFLHRLWVSVL